MLAATKEWTNVLPIEPMTWLTNRYGLTLKEIVENKICWWKEKQTLIFPVYDPNDNLVMFQGRYFGQDKGHPKYITYGKVSKTYDIHWNDNWKDVVILVEDFISAIKVSRFVTAMPIFGSHISTSRFKTLALTFKKAYLWLDPDKQNTYSEYMSKAFVYFDTTACINSMCDPKEYNRTEMSTLLYPYLKPVENTYPDRDKIYD